MNVHGFHPLKHLPTYTRLLIKAVLEPVVVFIIVTGNLVLFAGTILVARTSIETEKLTYTEYRRVIEVMERIERRLDSIEGTSRGPKR